MKTRSILFLATAMTSSAADITIRFHNPVSKIFAYCRCDANASRLGLPTVAFPVEYINGGGNRLICLESAGRRVSLHSETLGESVCQPTQ